ncbi:MerR family transcriptional regulator [Spongiactinospora sp. 9N601]|uniref:MerR family transcriptional regulator n=1 Tax=Spongiactinospora sp. 9N601 TaxID=3375149 RepID=UPI00379EEE09
MADDELYSITDVAAAFGLRVSALRYYEERGLIRPACRLARVRHYDRAALRSLALVRLWHHDGMMNLDDTAVLMGEPEPASWRNTLLRRADDLARQITHLQNAKEALDHFLECTSPNPAACPAMEEILDHRIEQALSRLSS